MTDDVAATRQRVMDVIKKAASDETFRAQLSEDPDTVLARHGIPEGSVEALSSADTSREQFLADDFCVHTDGCNDFTCIRSGCPASCFVTIHIEPPDA